MRAAGTDVGGCDAGYRTSSCLWGRAPEPLVVALGERTAMAGLRVLDAGCGEGRNAVHLARLGALVTAMDVSALALAHARAAWPAEPGVRWLRADVRSADLGSGRYDVVICDSLLHWLPSPEAAHALLARLRRATRPGGWHVVCAFNDRAQQLAGHTNPPRCLLGHEDIVASYASAELVEVLDTDVSSVHADQPELHRHSVTALLARIGGTR